MLTSPLPGDVPGRPRACRGAEITHSALQNREPPAPLPPAIRKEIQKILETRRRCDWGKGGGWNVHIKKGVYGDAGVKGKRVEGGCGLSPFPYPCGDFGDIPVSFLKPFWPVGSRGAVAAPV